MKDLGRSFSAHKINLNSSVTTNIQFRLWLSCCSWFRLVVCLFILLHILLKHYYISSLLSNKLMFSVREETMVYILVAYFCVYTEHFSLQLFLVTFILYNAFDLFLSFCDVTTITNGRLLLPTLRSQCKHVWYFDSDANMSKHVPDPMTFYLGWLVNNLNKNMNS